MNIMRNKWNKRKMKENKWNYLKKWKYLKINENGNEGK